MANIIILGHKSDYSKSRGVGETKVRDFFFSDNQVKQMIEEAIALYIRNEWHVCRRVLTNEDVEFSKESAKKFVREYVK
ncbi:hypothetical protein RyT2_11610 [Pseudolactococcus yaeyamensis]